MKNKFGLSRSISEKTKRIVRQRCGFGCIFCGNRIFDYEHVVDFSKVDIHDSDNICLLCSEHHAKVTRKIIPKEQVIAQNKNPYSIKRGYAQEKIESYKPIDFQIGRIYLLNPKEILNIAGDSLLSVDCPVDEPPLVSGKIFNSHGDLVVEIEKNEIKYRLSNWDIDYIGSKIIFRDSLGSIPLRLSVSSDSFIIDKINMKYKDIHIFTESKNGKLIINYKAKINIYFPNSVIQTGGPIKIIEDQLILENGAFMIMGEKGMKFL